MIVKHNKAVGDSVEWLNDAGRTHFWHKELQATAKDKIVMEVGANAGLLMYYALKAGAKKVIGVEIRTQRCQFLNTLFEKLGYSNFEIVNADFIDIDLKQFSPDIILLEQIGDQFKTDHSYLRQVAKIKKENPNSVIVPDAYNLDFYVFDGKVDIEDFIIPNHTLDQDLLTAWQEMAEVRPAMIERKQINEGQELSFVLDLSGFKDATIYIENPFTHKGQRVPCWTGHLCWDNPKKLYLDDCRSKVKFSFVDGEWKHSRLP
jgi:hypothetical protein